MKITNKYNLPQAVVNALTIDSYSKGESDYSITQLIDTPQIHYLKTRHWDNIEEDAMDRIWSIFGSAVHNVMENHVSDDTLSEIRYSTNILGKVVSGKIDCYNNKVLSDYKVTSSYSISNGYTLSKWEKQLNCYCYLLEKNGLKVDRLCINVFLRDWSKFKAIKELTYPATPFIIVPIVKWNINEQEKYLKERVQLFENCKDLSDVELPPCSKEDRMQGDETYAVMKKGQKRAVRLFDNEDEAKAYIFMTKRGDYVDKRAATPVRCNNYCSCAKFCSQYNKERAGGECEQDT